MTNATITLELVWQNGANEFVTFACGGFLVMAIFAMIADQFNP